MQKFQSFKNFYPYYLSEHKNRISKRLHFVGTSLTLALSIYVILTENWVFLLLLPICGYGFAWVGHFYFEKNKPATFTYPRWSLIADFVMFKDILLGKIPW